MKTITKIATVILTAALCSLVSTPFTFMMPVGVQLLGMALTFGWVAHVIWRNYDHAERIV